jgi:hypothetical protein
MTEQDLDDYIASRPPNKRPPGPRVRLLYKIARGIGIYLIFLGVPTLIALSMLIDPHGGDEVPGIENSTACANINQNC